MYILKRGLSILLAAGMMFSSAPSMVRAEESKAEPVSVTVEPSKNKAAARLKKLEKSDWTIAVYMCGTDLESSHGAATADLIEMLEADIPKDVTLLVMTGGTKTWNSQNEDKKAGWCVQ